MKIAEIEKYFKQLPLEQLQEGLLSFREDDRKGVKRLVQIYNKKWETWQKLNEDWEQKQAFDEIFYAENQVLVGIDEVGRGPLAGPVVAAAVVLPKKCTLLGVRDSKKITEIQREKLYEEIYKQALFIGVGIVDAKMIDEINILQATFRAMQQALKSLQVSYDVVLVDGDKKIPFVAQKQHAIIQGDDKSASIAAASIIAKVTRDRMMRTYHMQYPDYHWDKNKGYGSQQHYLAIHDNGITPLHRKSFLKNEGIK